MDYIEVQITLDPVIPFSEILICELGDIGFESFVENKDGFTAYIPIAIFQKESLEEVIHQYKDKCTVNFQTNQIVSQNWNAVWESSYEPVLVDDFCYVHAPFHQPLPQIPFQIVIEPKMSFGTAHHPTTYLMLSYLKEMVIEGKDILDMGCGTGVLAILASLKKATSVTAIDNDSWAFENTLENIQKNNCSNITVKLGNASLLQKQAYDIVLANINRNILLQDLKQYISSIKEQGFIIMSGFFESDIPTITEEAEKYNFTLDEIKTRNEWAAIKMSLKK